MQENTIKKTIIISGVNLSEGGPLTVMQSVLQYLNDSVYADEYKIYALVHSQKLFQEMNKIIFLEYPKVKQSWLRRLKFEYIDSLKISKKLKSFLWISMHDVSPNTVSEKKVVYCHSASVFYSISLSTIFTNPKLYLYTKLYKYLYAINIKKNNFVIVQQKWIKDAFSNLFNLDKNNIVIAFPIEKYTKTKVANMNISKNGFTFFYPALPREFKNFEIICEAVKYLNLQSISKKYTIILTINGTENRYTKKIFAKYGNIPNIQFIGLQSRNAIENYYYHTDALIFPSKLETWGLPISEFKKYKKPILVADLPYAYETIGDYEKVKYFNPNDATELAKNMKHLMHNTLIFSNKKSIDYTPPICHSWAEMIDFLIKE